MNIASSRIYKYKISSNCNMDNDKTTIKYHEAVTIKRTTYKQWLDGTTGPLIVDLINQSEATINQKGPVNCF